MASKFQTNVRYNPAAAIPGTIVEAADTYKYVRKGTVMAGKVATIGKFVVKDTTGDFRDVATGDTEFAGVTVLTNYITGEDSGYAYPAGSAIAYLENGIVAVETTHDANDNDTVSVDLATGDIYIGTATGKTDTGWKCVRHTELEDGVAGIAFIKK